MDRKSWWGWGGALFVDLPETFEPVPHDLLLAKLNVHGID